MTSGIAHKLAAGILAAVFVSVAAAEEIAPSGLSTLPPADVIVLGEVHDNPAHHANQAAAIAALGVRAIVFEMLTAEQADRLRPAHYGTAQDLSDVLGWEASGWPEFGMYYPIFTAGRGALVLGGAVDRALVRKAMTEGAAAALPDVALQFGLDAPLPAAEQARREEGQATAHCGALPPDLLPSMVEAQRLRDAALARAVLTAIRTAGGPVAVITGNGHARTDWGLPALLARAMPHVTVLSIGQFEETAPADPPYDLWLVTDGVDRADPCLAFRTP